MFKWDGTPADAVAFTPDGHTVATASSDGRSVKLWDPLTGQERLTLRYEERKPARLAFTPDGHTLLVSWAGNPRLKSPAGVITLYRAAPKER